MSEGSKALSDIYSIPLTDKRVLVYSPLRGLSAVVNPAAAAVLRRAFVDENTGGYAHGDQLTDLLSALSAPHPPAPQVNAPGLSDPLFLGLLPTRACSMGCRYCDFATAKCGHNMPLDRIRLAIDSYLRLLKENAHKQGQIHFFGGEPLFAFEELSFAVLYARRQATAEGIELRFEITSNGYYPAERAAWAADNIDSIVLSFDGFAETQNQQRPGKHGETSFDCVARSAAIFSQGGCELNVRSCITQANYAELPRWAEWLGERYVLSGVCFEPMIDSSLSRVNHISSCPPLDFVRAFCQSRQILQEKGVRLIFASADTQALRASLCPLGRDTLIISPEGLINGCWQIESFWQEKGFDLSLGRLSEKGFDIRQERLDALRSLCTTRQLECRGCFCNWHCAGGCVLNHAHAKADEIASDFCLMTRLITLVELLQDAGQMDLAQSILSAGDPFAIVRAHDYRLANQEHGNWSQA